MPQALTDIAERIELLKMTLGMFAPGEPGPVAVEIVQLGEEILEHALLAAGVAPTAPPAEGARLMALLAQCRRIDPDFAALDPTCRALLDRHDQAMAAAEADDPQAAQHLAAAAGAAGDLYSSVAARLKP